MRSGQLLLNKFFDPSTPSMRKGDDGGEKTGKTGGKKRKKIMMKIVATNVVASQPPERRPTAMPTLVPKRDHFSMVINLLNLLSQCNETKHIKPNLPSMEHDRVYGVPCGLRLRIYILDIKS